MGLVGGSVGGGSLVGGLVGSNRGIVSNSYATGSVSGNNYVGGLVGGSVGTVSNSYATGSISGNSYVGGLVGYNQSNGTVINSYATGSVSGLSFVGGLVGANSNGTASNSFWNFETSGQNSSAGGLSMATTDMQMQTNFTSATSANGNVDPGWDFADTWVMYDGHTDPLLRSFMTPLTVKANNAGKTYDGQAYSGGNGVIYSSTPNDNLLGTVSYSGASQGAINANSYAITPEGLWSNQQGYIINYADGTLTVNPRPLDLTGSRVYDGTTVVSSGIFTLGNLVSGETLILSGSGSVASKNVSAGNQAVTPETLALSDGSGLAANYSFTGGTQTASFTPATLTYTATPAGFFSGQTPGGLTGMVSGFATGDTLADSTTGALAWMTNAGPNSQPGQYYIDGDGLISSNYVFVQASGNATALTLKPGTSNEQVNNVRAQLESSVLSCFWATSACPPSAITMAQTGKEGSIFQIENGGVKLPDNMVNVNE